MDNISNISNYIIDSISESISVKQSILQDLSLIEDIGKVSLKIVSSLKKGGKLIIAGNGGSAADAQHIAGEFISRFNFDRKALAAIALTTDTSILTAIGNDYGYEFVFSRQVEGLGNKDDIFFAISTSGNSKNIIKALEVCKEKNIFSIGLTGKTGGAMDSMCDVCLKAPSTLTPRIQEAHLVIYHIICAIVEEELLGKGFK